MNKSKNLKKLKYNYLNKLMKRYNFAFIIHSFPRKLWQEGIINELQDLWKYIFQHCGPEVHILSAIKELFITLRGQMSG